MLGRMSRIFGLSVCIGGVWSLTGAGCLPSGVPGSGGVIGSGSLTNLPPVAVITASVLSGIAPVTIEFSSDRITDDGVIVTRSWDFGDGTTSLEISPTHTFETTGEFTVALTLTDDGGAVTTTGAQNYNDNVTLGAGTTLSGRLLTYDALTTKFRELKMRHNPNCPTCGEGVDRSKIELIDYAEFCRAG